MVMERFFKNNNVALKQEYEDWGILFHHETNQGIVVNQVGMMIWEALGDGNDLAAIVAIIENEFEDAPATLADDVREFLEALIRAGFVMG
jgi:hypothetical protein